MKDIALRHFITALQRRGLRIMPVCSMYRCGEQPSEPPTGSPVFSRNSGFCFSVRKLTVRRVEKKMIVCSFSLSTIRWVGLV